MSLKLIGYEIDESISMFIIFEQFFEGGFSHIQGSPFLGLL